VLGRELDHHTDIWGLGVVLYEMLAGCVPFRGDYLQALFRSIAEDAPPDLRASGREIPAELERVVLKALAKNPADRYHTAAEMRDVLRAAQPPLAISSAPAFTPRAAPAVPSIAVLPFANLTSDPENEYFTDGLTDELI